VVIGYIFPRFGILYQENLANLVEAKKKQSVIKIQRRYHILAGMHTCIEKLASFDFWTGRM
jgi:hypothetical protein